MTPELGHLALILATLVAAVQGTLPLVGAHRGQAGWIALARPAAQTQFALVLFAFACLMQAFVANDFSVLYVAEHSNAQLPTAYRAAAVWGGHEGSLLLWQLMLSGWTCAVSLLSRQLPEAMVARVIGVLGLVAVGLLAFLLLTSNPFERLLPAAPQGQDLNPLLQDPGLVIHPPMLYMGYVGFSVAFAFAIAALLAGRLDAAWARWSRPWTNAAWVFLTLGIALGSYWAYYELGWGGWWFWDPVENASFMPWLAGTALIHSLAVTEKRGSFRNWTVLLAIAAFSLSLMGTFLVRSGVLTSVHAFASDPRRGLFILAFLTVVVGSSLTLFAWRAPRVGMGGGFELLSRETLLLVNNVLLVVACGTVLLGTLYPLIIDALNLGKLSVGPPYFNAVFVPVMVPLLVLLGIGPLARWKQADARELARRLRVAAVLAVGAAAAVPLLAGRWTPGVAMALLLAVWVAASSLCQVRERLASGWPPRSFWGMQLAHMGVAVFVAGVGLVKGYEQEKDVRMAVGDTVAIGGYQVEFQGMRELPGPNYTARQGVFSISRDGHRPRELRPEKRRYHASQAVMTETAIDSGFTHDLYLSLGEPLASQGLTADWSVRVYYKPFVTWIWFGCLLMALGGAIAAADRRFRLKARRTAPAAATGAPA
ncbi:heme lyase CcmF/NrfE family subunit [Roseateles cellulosilyticus]|uniref:Heme lyase CcmF/NrfE family subunit n=1 Tax=Pelomonas cellulosilytica TaxID=2906762 RepID=A0ABS8XJ71_9BURK|nr:heme lyase CcmF/NrfE family subunit [Pelomonas sp. P8]MCE4552911.1 heme lyase CcmF/NrfE family subunit [Pelomonas sp. P8]